MPKRGCDVTTCEVGRFYRLNNNGFCQVIPFKVPRKSELFQEDLYPETQADIPAITAEEWWTQKKNADPVLMSMADGGGSTSQSEELVVKKVCDDMVDSMVEYIETFLTFLPHCRQHPTSSTKLLRWGKLQLEERRLLPV